MANFNELASKKLSEVERPVLLPVGDYRMSVTKLPTVTDKPEWEIVEFSLRPLEAITADISDYKGEIGNNPMRLAFLFDKNDEVAADKTMFRLRTFLEKHLGLGDDMSVKEAMNASVNAQCLASVQHVQDKNDKELFHANVTATAPLA